MVNLDLALQVSVVVFMVGSLAGVGLGLSPRDELGPLTNVRFVAVSLFASWVVSPGLAWGLLQVVPLERSYATGLLLLALAPCAPFAPAMAQIAGGHAAYMAAFMLVSALTTVLIMPLAVPLLIEGLSADPLAIARPLLLFVLLPLLLGMAVHVVRPRAAERARPTVARITNVSGVLLLALVAVIHGRSVIDAIGSYAIATQIVFLVAVTASAYLLGAGLAHEQRSVLTIGVSTRNLGAALAPLLTAGADSRAIVMIAISVPLTLAVAALMAHWLGYHYGAAAGRPPAVRHVIRRAG